MPASKTLPVLYHFAISHYCEKARWALDYFKIDYRAIPLAPGPHIKFCRNIGVGDTSLPILAEGKQALQGSAQIIDWAEAKNVDTGISLEAELNRPECLEIEQRLDAIFGIHVRRYFYSDALLNQPEKVRPMFLQGLPWIEQIIIRLGWPKICKAMIRGLDLGAEQGQDSRQIIDAELDWLDDMLADGRDYLVGDRFSRADLTAASLVSTLALPPEHPTYHRLQIPPGVVSDLAEWQQRPSIRWVREMYRRHR